MQQHAIGDRRYSVEEIVAIAAAQPSLSLDARVERKIAAGARYVAGLASSEAQVYGINTGFGALSEHRVAPGELQDLQRNHLLSHAAGVGSAVDEVTSRVIMLVKLLTFRSGHTGIGLRTVQRLIDIWNSGYTPQIPRKGTVGASGDLAPLAHMALPIIGLGQLQREGNTISALELQRRMDWEPLQLLPKEGLALTNGIQFIASLTARSLVRARTLATFADLLAALSLQAFSCASTFFDERYVATSPIAGRRTCARHLRWASAGSNHAALSTSVGSKQDPYSFRCIPQVHGASLEVLEFCKHAVEDEINGTSDNPLFFADDEVALYGGNLHGELTAFAADFLAIAMSEIGSISERRTYQLMSGSRGLPDFLTTTAGVSSGLMILQYTAAALVSENKCLCHPASVDSIPTCQLKEDHVSMGGGAAHKLAAVLDNLEYILAVELIAATQACELNRELLVSPLCAELMAEFRGKVARLTADRVLSEDVEAARTFIVDRGERWAARALKEAG